jgi:hypothetical protein
MRIALEAVLLTVTVLTVVAFLALMFWGAREDGREQRRHESRLRQRR